jgi:hypothetical protein
MLTPETQVEYLSRLYDKRVDALGIDDDSDMSKVRIRFFARENTRVLSEAFREYQRLCGRSTEELPLYRFAVGSLPYASAAWILASTGVVIEEARTLTVPLSDVLNASRVFRGLPLDYDYSDDSSSLMSGMDTSEELGALSIQRGQVTLAPASYGLVGVAAELVFGRTTGAQYVGRPKQTPQH